MLDIVLLSALAKPLTVGIAGSLVLKAANSEPAKALYSQIAPFLGPWHERRTMLMKVDTFHIAFDKLNKMEELSTEERSLLEKAVFGADTEKPTPIESDRIENRALERRRNEDDQEQINMENIVDLALQQINDEHIEVVSVDPQWFADFFDACRKVTNDDIRAMWAKILTLQSTGQGNLSKRALEALRLFDRRDGDVLQSIGRWTLNFSNAEGLPIVPIRPLLADEDLKRAQTIGVIGAIEDLILAGTYSGRVDFLHLSDHSKVTLHWDKLPIEPGYTKTFFAWLTPLGRELLTVVDRIPDVEFLRQLGVMYRQHGATLYHHDPVFDAALKR